jgi:hypothetical protein
MFFRSSFCLWLRALLPRLALVAGAGGLTAGACAQPSAGVASGPEIGLARGGGWSVLALKLPYLSGPHFNLALRDHVLVGWIAGETGPGGTMRVRIERDGASGYGPHGAVALHYDDHFDELVAAGVWNGQRLKVAFSSLGIHGVVANNSRPAIRSPLDPVPGLPRSRLQRLLADNPLEPAARDSSCQYLLDHKDRDGALLGTSICAGLPQPTRLEIPPTAAALLDRSELITVLIAMLSAPPVASAERAPLGLDLELDRGPR